MSVNKSDSHQTSSVIPLATGDEVIKFWVRCKGRWGRYALYSAHLVPGDLRACMCISLVSGHHS